MKVLTAKCILMALFISASVIASETKTNVPAPRNKNGWSIEKLFATTAPLKAAATTTAPTTTVAPTTTPAKATNASSNSSSNSTKSNSTTNSTQNTTVVKWVFDPLLNGTEFELLR